MALWWAWQLTFYLVQCLLVFSPGALAADADFEGLLALPPSKLQPDHIPKKVHFVYVNLQPLTWMEYAAVKAALALTPESINLWIPLDGGDPPGPIWQSVLGINGTVLRRMQMPDSVFGNSVKVIQHVADVVRLMVLHEEGGILRYLCEPLAFPVITYPRHLLGYQCSHTALHGPSDIECIHKGNGNGTRR